MARDIDDKKKRKALRKLRKAAERADATGTELSDWEKQFIEEVEERVETYGSAFSDLEKGAPDEPLSMLQNQKLKEIDKKSRGKGMKRSGFKNKSGKSMAYSPRSRDINDDVDEPPEEMISREPKLLESGPAPTQSAETGSAPRKRPILRVIEGGNKGHLE